MSDDLNDRDVRAIEKAHERKHRDAVRKAQERWRRDGYDPLAHLRTLKVQGDTEVMNGFAHLEYGARGFGPMLASRDIYETLRVARYGVVALSR